MAEAAAAGDGGAAPGTGTGAAALEELMLELDVDDEMRWGRDGGSAVKGDAQQLALKRAALPTFGLSPWRRHARNKESARHAQLISLLW